MSSAERTPGLTGTVVRGVSLAGSGYVIARVITLVSYIILARLVTPDEMGEFTAGIILIGIGVLFAESGMAAAVIHRREQVEEAAATAVVATSLAGVLWALLGLASAPLLGLFFDSDTVAAVTTATAGVLLLNSARVVPNAILQRRFSFLRRLVVEPAATIAFGVGAIIATSEGMGVWGLVIGQYAYSVTDFVLSWTLVQWRPQFRLASFAMWRELIDYGRHVLAGTAVRRIGDRVPTLAAGGFVGAAALGQLQYANRIVTTQLALLVQGVSYVVFPAFARISHDERRFVPAFLRSLRWMLIAAAPLGLILAPLGEPLAILVFGNQWAEAGEATVALCILVPARAVAAVTLEAFKGAGVPRNGTVVNIIGVVAGVLAAVALVPPFGLIGVALAVSVDAIASALESVRRAHGSIGVPVGPMLRAINIPLAAAIVMVAVIFPLEHLVVDAAAHGTLVGLLLVGGEALLGFAVYAAALLLLNPGTGSELKGLARNLRLRNPRSGARPDATEAIPRIRPMRCEGLVEMQLVAFDRMTLRPKSRLQPWR